ncbi:dual CXXC motif small (seleno)protein [uncultured Desulfosarcina sp.]
MEFRCTGCGASFPLSRFIHLMDETMEQQLAFLRCDRI